MDKEFVTLELGVKLKQLGFNDPCLVGVINNETLTAIGFSFKNYNNNVHDFVLPLWQQAFEWFEEKHNLEGIVKSWKEGNDNYFYYSVNKLFSASHYQMKYTTRLQAKIACLEKLIETTTV